MPASNYRFSAAQLFYAISLSAASTALFGFWGLAIAAFIALVWWQILCGVRRETQQLNLQPALCDLNSKANRRNSRKAMLKVELAVGLVISIILLGLLIPAPSDSDPMCQAATSMQMIAKAMASYEQQYGQYPPDVTYGRDSQPMHSWRALILEQLGEKRLASAYRMDEPWDGPNNSKLAQYRPWHYRTFYDQESDNRTETSIHRVALGATSIVVEHEQMKGNWLQPTEMNIDRWNKLNQVPELDQGFWHRGFFVSHYRGRLAVTQDVILQVQPGTKHSDLSMMDFQNANPKMQIVGDIGAQYHFGNALHLAFFLIVALYPIRWLKIVAASNRSGAGASRPTIVG